MQKPLGIHHIRSKLFSLYLSKLPALYNSCLENHVKNPNSNEYKLTAIVLDIAGHRLFKSVGIKKDEIDKHSFLKLSFEKEDLDTLSEWMKCVRSLIQIRIKKLNGSMRTRSTSIFKDLPKVAQHLSLLHD